MSLGSDQVLKFVNQLLDEGGKLEETKFESSSTSNKFVETRGFTKWLTSCRMLLTQLGEFASSWEFIFPEKSSSSLSQVIAMLGALESIKENLEQDRLVRIEDLIFAEAFVNLIDQGEYLLGKDYYLAAGVIFRSVLEEKLRRLCEANKVLPDKERPTISDLNIALYKANVYDKVMMKQIDAMATIGNEAAHNKPELDKTKVEDLHRNLVSFLAKFSH